MVGNGLTATLENLPAKKELEALEHEYVYIEDGLLIIESGNFFKLKKKFVSFHEDIRTEIKKIEDYLKELNKV